MAFAIFQDAQVLRDKKGASTVKVDTRYQVTISELQDLTGINFGDMLYDRNPLFYHDIAERNELHNVATIPERIVFGAGRDVVGESDEKRGDVEHLNKRRIVINSAMINPKNIPERSGEWISLHNRSNNNITVDGWKLIDGKNRKAFLNGTISSGESIKLQGAEKGKIQLSNNGEI